MGVKNEDLGRIYSKKAWQLITQQVITQQHEVTKKYAFLQTIKRTITNTND